MHLSVTLAVTGPRDWEVMLFTITNHIMILACYRAFPQSKPGPILATPFRFLWTATFTDGEVPALYGASDRDCVYHQVT